MTVLELIEKLKKFDADLPVIYRDDECYENSPNPEIGKLDGGGECVDLTTNARWRD